MNERELDRVLAALVDEGPLQAPDHVIEAALAEIPTTSQRGSVARPWRSTMLRPLAAFTAVAAIIALVVYFGAAPPTDVGGSPTPSPSPSGSAAPTTYESSTFTVPIAFPVEQGFGVEPEIEETASTLTITLSGTSTNHLILLPLEGAEVVADDGSRPITTAEDLIAALETRPGISAARLLASDTGVPATWTMLGTEAPVVTVDVDPTQASPDEPIFRTAAGASVDVAAEPWSMWVMIARPPDGPGLLAIYSSRADEFGDWSGTLLSTLDGLELQP